MEKGRYITSVLVSAILGVLVGFGAGNLRPVEPEIITKEVVVYVEKEPEIVDTPMAIEEPIIVEEEEVIVEEPIIVEEPVIWQTLDSTFDITMPSNLSSQELIDMLGPARSGMHYVVDSIIQAEQIYGINALYLTATLGYESGWGRYESGSNNIAGWKDVNGYFRNFSSIEECVMTVAEGLATSFVPDVGSSLGPVALRYCPDYGYLDTLLQIMSELQYGI